MADPKHTTLNELLSLIDPETVANKKINTIKLLRQITGEGLKEVKEFYEQEWEPFVTRKEPASKPSTKGIVGSRANIVIIDDVPSKPDDLPPPMFLVGHSYKQLDGCTVMVLGVSNPNTSYETVYTLDSDGNVIHRYNRRDFGRCTGSDHENPDPRNLERLT